MVLTETPHLSPGGEAPDFSLTDEEGKRYTLSSVRGKEGLLVMFICNHCPYVQAIVHRLVEETKVLVTLGIGSIAFMPNDVEQFPLDAPDKMRVFAKENAFSFPYLWDETQEIAHAYGAVCTPDFFLFDKELRLYYRGRLVEVSHLTITGGSSDLVEAAKKMRTFVPPPSSPPSSMGCSIKWK